MGRTLVILTADLANAEKMKNSFSAARLEVPLMFFWQGEGRLYNQLSSHLDIMPTLFSQFFGVLSPANDYTQGIDLSKPNNRLWVLASNHQWNVAIMPDGEQFHLDRRGQVENFNAEGTQIKSEKPPLALFLQMIKLSNQFVNK